MSEPLFTSDTHFYHKNIIRFCNCPFKTVEEMNEALIERWNAKVKKGDLVAKPPHGKADTVGFLDAVIPGTFRNKAYSEATPTCTRKIFAEEPTNVAHQY